MTKVELCGVSLKNPVIAASGTFGFGEEYKDYYDVGRLGGISGKGLTLHSKQGNDGIRIYESRGGMLNSVGLQNPGIEKFITKELPLMLKYNTAIIANVGGSSVEEYMAAIERLNNEAVDIIELNISCPNVLCGGMAFGIKSKVAYDVVCQVKSVCKKPLMVKLSPNAEDIVDMAYKCCEAGADALSLVNTFKGMAVDIHNRRAIFNNIYAGVSGPSIKPMALRMVHEVCKAVNVPVVGMGGISTFEDAIEFIMVGAQAVGVGTANFIKPDVCLDIIEGIEKYMIKEGIKDLSEIRGII
ncbi:dihydroorotate dehydrogenase [Clostridium estertheticum]|uniref:dihydroorotate dehydrogenase n=1 Tax=Clostridium estertheticum TaxID=238834 RepID=UPI001C6F58F2|nr:dihydroorotate dehydrogenase [Clostridium estertheticum]MBW9173711.1 dihydroorotate dehydrogenase [Clostridium estertheticum]WLC75329.1 dihydroorotate dehydrogenase [Clostridium estertheticum]